MERVRRPLPLPRLHDDGGRPDALRRARPRRRAARHARLLHRRLAARARFIGWTPQLRERNLPLGVDNPRFLILPWIHIPNVGSHILAIVRRQLPLDWTARYNTTPVLIETFVETPRHTGAVYRASGWTRVGATQGRGHYDRRNRYDKLKKDIWLRPLRKDWKGVLNR